MARDPSGNGRAVLRRNTTPGTSCVGNPAFSPDGASLVLETCDGLGTMRADGSGFLQLPRFSQPEGADGLSYALDAEPAWSPDGGRLVFVSVSGYDDGFTSDESRGLVIVNADGSGPRRLTGERVAAPQWSSRGSIAFSAWRRGGDPGIWVIRSDGSGLRRIVGRAEQPAWSPDGRRIAFARGRRGNAPYRTLDTRICVAGAGGTSVRTVARGFSPAWSPNGRRLAFVQGRRRGGRLSWAIYTIRLDGSDRRLVARSHREVGALDWQPVT